MHDSYIILIILIIFTIKFDIKLCSPIVNGVRIEQEFFNDYSFVISLQEKSAQQYNENFVHLCGGVFINEKWILTAAHCVHNKNISNLFIQVGIRILDPINHSRYSIEKLQLYKFYNEYTMKNDIALIKISTTYSNFINYLQYVNEPNSIDLIVKENSCKILGYGTTRYGEDNQNNLYEANVKLMTNRECIAVLGRILAPNYGDNTICAVGLNGEDACQGDSGGPLVCSHNGSDYLFGIVSYGSGCGTFGIPSIYTMVYKYTKWINDTIFQE